MEISKMTLADFEEISDVLQTEFDEFWNSNILRSEIENDNTYYITAKENNQIVGFAGILIGIDVIEVMNIVVRKSNRKMGIGEALLRELIKASQNIKKENLNNEKLNLECLTLEVNVKNIPARKLYEKVGFEEVRI
jgi:ribosomal-protein-alanine N-acetyltransferase